MGSRVVNKIRHRFLLYRGWKVNSVRRWEVLIHLGTDKIKWTTVEYVKANRLKCLRFNGHHDIAVRQEAE